jgi:cell wall-associated NlpC family hydrolase
MQHQETWTDGKSVMIRRASGATEEHPFESKAEARSRAAVIVEALSWVGTPFKNCADVKGPNGCVDCAMLMVRANVDTGRIPPFDPRPYPSAWMLHQREEKFLSWIRDRLGGIEVDHPRVADNIVWRFGLCFSHGGILINSEEVVHAWVRSGIVQVARLDETELAFTADGKPRAMKAFEVRR